MLVCCMVGEKTRLFVVHVGLFAQSVLKVSRILCLEFCTIVLCCVWVRACVYVCLHAQARKQRRAEQQRASFTYQRRSLGFQCTLKSFPTPVEMQSILFCWAPCLPSTLLVSGMGFGSSRPDEQSLMDLKTMPLLVAGQLRPVWAWLFPHASHTTSPLSGPECPEQPGASPTSTTQHNTAPLRHSQGLWTVVAPFFFFHSVCFG